MVNYNPILKAGEIAIAIIPNNSDGVQNAPAILAKAGDGKSSYNDLNFISGLAADVYEWAKKANKPDYSASEINGLGEFIGTEVDTITNTEIDSIFSK